MVFKKACALGCLSYPPAVEIYDQKVTFRLQRLRRLQAVELWVWSLGLEGTSGFGTEAVSARQQESININKSPILLGARLVGSIFLAWDK